MQTVVDIKKKLAQALEPQQADVLSEVITEAYSALAKTADSNELKGIVKELAEAQKRTDIKDGMKPLNSGDSRNSWNSVFHIPDSAIRIGKFQFHSILHHESCIMNHQF